MENEMPAYTPILATLGYVMSPDGKSVLLIHRNTRPDDIHYSKYNGLGGKIDSGEELVAGMRREIREEAGIEAHELTMYLTTMLVVGGLILAIVVAALFVLNRSWGNFPDRVGGLPPASSSAPGISPQVPTPWNQLDAEREQLEQQQTEQISTAEPA